MSLAVINIKEGLTPVQKAELMKKTKEACMNGLGVGVLHSFCRINEIKAEDCDEQTKGMVNLFVYTTEGKSLEGKDRVCRDFENACREVLGEDFGFSIVIFKEHSDENAGSKGQLRPFKPGYPDY